MNWKALYEKFKMCLCFSVFAIFVSICVCPSVSVFLVVFTRLPFLVCVSLFVSAFLSFCPGCSVFSSVFLFLAPLHLFLWLSVRHSLFPYQSARIFISHCLSFFPRQQCHKSATQIMETNFITLNFPVTATFLSLFRPPMRDFVLIRERPNFPSSIFSSSSRGSNPLFLTE